MCLRRLLEAADVLLVRGPMVELALGSLSLVHSLLQALQWTYMEDEHDVPNDSELLYTNFGRQAKHRRTPLVQKFKQYETTMNMSLIYMCGLLRLITGPDEFRRLHSSTPLTRVAGFDPFRVLAFTLVGHVVLQR